MKKLFFALLFSSILISQERYSQVEIPVQSKAEFQRIAALGVAIDHFTGKVGGNISVFLSASELKILDDAGIHYSVQINDWQQYYAEQQQQDSFSKQQFAADVPKYFRYGSMGGFLIFDEILQQLDSMTLLFPNLVTKKDSIGVTIEGRTIFAIKISDNPNTTEQTEPEVLYTALHHAREPEGMMTVIYYMWWLLENYGKDAEATFLVNNRQMWFIPVVNPDGYVYNHTINPSGGGGWRKNRRNNGDGTFGIDLNRNYGQFFMWNAPNNGSSASTGSDTYRGTTPFSEPETFAMSQFLKKHSVKTAFNYHTYGNYLIYPWGYSSSESNDSLLFRLWSYDMSMTNRYSIGTDQQTVGYSTRGNSDDYAYSDSAKSRTYALTPEVGTTGFWPVKSLIYPLAQENLLQNKLLSYYAGPYLAIKSYTVDKKGVTVRFINKGLAETNDMPIYLSTSDGIAPPSILSGVIPSFSESEKSFSISQGANVSSIKIYLQDSSGAMLKDSITFFTGIPAVLLNDSANSTSLWSMGTSWGLVFDPITSDGSFTDSPNGNYAANTENSLTLLNTIDLTTYQLAELKFRTKWSIESTWDFALVEVSTNGGSNWISLKTQLSRKGSGRTGSKQPSTSYGYDAFTPGLTWVEQTADLTPYVGKQIKLRFRLSADGGDQRDGWYVDDIRVLAYTTGPNSVKEQSVPYTYSLAQNFPNPFNPSTTIQFSVEQLNRTSLRVYNVLGQEVAMLLDQDVAPGTYSINFDAKQLSSGVYFYRFTSGNYTSIKKMTLVK
ncbi:MAG: M14 family zinc carboxypeptidase [Bacteroidota bacterium]